LGLLTLDHLILQLPVGAVNQGLLLVELDLDGTVVRVPVVVEESKLQERKRHASLLRKHCVATRRLHISKRDQFSVGLPLRVFEQLVASLLAIIRTSW